MPHTRVICPVCDGTDFTVLDTAPAASRCQFCGLGIEHTLAARPLSFYERGAYDATRDHGAGSDRWTRFHHDSAVAADRMGQLEKVLPATQNAKGLWVDVGCSNGAVLVAARKRGWQVVGTEFDRATADEVSRVLGFLVLEAAQWYAAANAPGNAGKANVVSLFDVLEHVLDPVGLLQAAVASLAADGIVVIEVPDFGTVAENPEAFVKWHHRRVKPGEAAEHQWHFTADALDTLRTRRLTGVAAVRTTRPVAGKLQVVWRKK